MTPIWAHHEKDKPLYDVMCRYISERIWSENKGFAPGTVLAVADKDQVIAGVIFTNYDRDAEVIEMSAAADSPRWLTRPILWEMFSYAFNELGCQAAVLRCDPKDTRLGRILTAYGFSRYVIPRLRGRDKPEALFILGDDEWRANGFHKENDHVQKGRTRTDAS